MSFRYAITERNARAFASRFRSSSRRCISRGLSEIGLTGCGCALASSCCSSMPFVADKPPKKGLELGIGMLSAGGPSMGRKLRRLFDLAIGEGGTRKLAEAGVVGVGDSLSVSVDALLGKAVVLGRADGGGDPTWKEML